MVLVLVTIKEGIEAVLVRICDCVAFWPKSP